MEVKMSQPVEVTDSNFENEILKSDKPCIVDFWAEWCGPCHMVSPILEEIAKEYEGKLKVGKLNVDENNQTAGKYGIMSIPNVLFFNGGKMVDQIIGAVPKKHFIEKVEKLVK
jgi:thioredoxin 1